MTSYIKQLREKIGHQKVILNFTVGIIFNYKGEILLQKRGDSLKWGLPGGAVELGESLDEAVRREVFEETGLNVDVEKILGVYSGRKYQEIRKNGDKCQPVVVAFYSKTIEGKLKTDNNETLSLEYFSHKKLPAIHNNQHEDIIFDAFNKASGVWK